MIEKQKYKKLIKTDSGYTVDKIVEEHEIPYYTEDALYTLIPNLDLWDTEAIGYNVKVRAA